MLDLLARQSIARGLSVRQAETAARARKTASPKQARPARGGFDDELAHLAVDAAWQSLNLKATVRMGPRGGRVELHFTTTAELGRIVDQLRAERLSWAD